MFNASKFDASLFMGARSSQRRSLGQFDWIIPVATGLIQSTPAAIAAYNAKRAADRAKQDKKRAEEEAVAAQVRAEAAAKAAADARAKAADVLDAQITTSPTGAVQSNKIMGVDPVVFVAGGLGILGVGVALLMALRK